MKSDIVDLILCVCFGYFGVHKFYEGNKKMGLIYLFTLGLFGIGWIVDIFALSIKLISKSQDKCVLCGNIHFTFLMKEKDNYYICDSCSKLCDKLNSPYQDSIYHYSIADLKKSIQQNKSVYTINYNAEKETYIRKRKKEYLDTLS